ncbi:phosphatidylinositol-specific phospholipase C [Paraburkholderia phenazinium]|uniref:1-phosphatidylinositol phosphodiesterase n=1 Tax=Paraburkholderia phenazinium TaxID=60549 RepID=A0A1G8L7R5_9BURK|nr:phosphatidylinositol-specific phospholipase C [Paraburkholderia phenazinium]SDI51577.1 1-phosphatidylinositol phosphodiesterase [Paraburkholderia phenazinium]
MSAHLMPAEPALARWMSALPDERMLNQLTLPGSHDTCAYTVDDSLARTQGATLTEQLAHGVRVLDIRCRHEDDVFHINHARIALGLMFDDVIADCAGFLAQHPSECIVMSVKDECGTRACTRSFEATFEAYLVRYPEVRWYLGNTTPCLADVRGSIVLLRRFESATPLGIDLSAWPDNSTFDLDIEGAAFTIQDEFRVPVRVSMEYKWRVIEALLARTPQLSAARWVLNFCSGTGMAANPHAVACGDQAVRGMNERFTERINERINEQPGQHDGPAGTVMIDFCEHDDWALVRALVARNPLQIMPAG